jgi:hypothetical protein
MQRGVYPATCRVACPREWRHHDQVGPVPLPLQLHLSRATGVPPVDENGPRMRTGLC